MQKITVDTKKSYDIYVGEHLLAQTAQLLGEITSFAQVVIVTDDIVADLYLDTVKQSFPDQSIVSSFVIKNGEQSKNAENLLALYDFMAEQNITRSDLVIALGGGVVGDLTGFCASSFLRGIKYVQIPTTLLAQVDSSVGGKTAINIKAGKNLVGSFYQPIAVLCDTATLSTLSDPIFSDGVAEIIKYGCIYDRTLFDRISEIRNKETLEQIIVRCIEIKAEIVKQDEFDLGLRMILNFGHTLGHAVEKYYDFTTYTHGQGVAIGMVKITALSEAAGYTQKGTTKQIVSLLKQFQLPTTCALPDKKALELCCHDKKNINNAIHLILLKEIGSCIVQKMRIEELSSFLNTAE